MSENNLIEFVDNTLMPNLNYLTVLAPLSPEERGSRIVLACPACGQKEAYIYKNGDSFIKCNRQDKCGYRASIFDYLAEKTNARGRDWVAAVKKACSISGVEFPEIEWTPEQIRRLEEHQQKHELLNDLNMICINALNQEIGASGRKYLQDRGLSQEQIVDYRFGYYPNLGFIKKTLSNLGYLDSDMKCVMRPDWDGRIICPIYYRRQIKDFWARDITDKADDDKKYLRGAKEFFDTALLFGLDDVEKDDALLVEGYFDAITLGTHGIKNVVAVGTNALTSGQIEKLIKAKISKVTLLFDNDQAGKAGRLKTINDLKNTGIRLYVMPPDALGMAKDPDEFIRNGGTVEDIVANKIDAFRYFAQYLAAKNKSGKDWRDDEVDSVIIEGEKFEQSITNPDREKSLDRFWKELEAILPITDETVDRARKRAKKEKERLRYKKEFENYQSEMDRLIKEGQYKEAIALSKPQLFQDDELEQLLDPDSEEKLTEEFLNINPGIDTGYTLDNAALEIPDAALTIIAGATTHGKTTVLQNLTLGVIQKNTDIDVYFFSYEETAAAIKIKFMNTAINLQLTNGNNKSAIKHYYRSKAGRDSLPPSHYIKTEMRDVFEQKKEEYFKKIVNPGRLKISDSNYSVEELVDAMRYIKEKNPRAGLFVVDYIQLLHMKEKPSSGSRYEELREVCDQLKVCAIEASVPILLAAQFNREVTCETDINPQAAQKIADCIDISRYANLMIGIWNKTLNAAETERENNILLQVIKGRDIGTGRNATLPFNGNTGKIEQEATTKYQPATQSSSDQSDDASEDQVYAFNQKKRGLGWKGY